jgi:hypothetical protein
LQNFQKANSSFGTDHYPFADMTTNNGFHNQVTTPGYVSTPPTVPVEPPVTTTFPIFYGFQPLDAGGMTTTNLGLLQYSRGPSNAVPTPVTNLQSTAIPIVLVTTGTTNVLDFTGIPRAIGMLYGADLTMPTNVTTFLAYVVWNGTILSVRNIFPLGATLYAQSAGAILQVVNQTAGTLNNVYWTLDLRRVS